jgi:hypothetical protein
MRSTDLPAQVYSYYDPVGDATATSAIYHDRSECRAGQLILRDRNEVFGAGARRHCGECGKYQLAAQRSADAKGRAESSATRATWSFPLEMRREA